MGNQQSAETGAELSGHSKAVYACCCSQDGAQILSASGDGTLKLWDVRKLACIRDFVGHNKGNNKVAVYACALSGDDKHAISGALDGSVKVWDVSTGKELFSVKEHQNAVMQVAFNPLSPQAISASADKTIMIWDLSVPEDGGKMAGEKVATLTGHRSAVNAAVFGPSGNTVISGSSDTTIRVWNLANLKEIKTLQGHKDAVMSVAVSKDGSTVISSSQDQSVGVWSVKSGKLLKMLQGHTDSVSSCVLSSDGSFILSASLDRGVIAWMNSTEHAHEWERACTFHPHRRGITSCAVTPDGLVSVTGGWDNTVRLSPLEDVRLSALVTEGPQEEEAFPCSLAALLTDPLLTEEHPHLVEVVTDMANMEGAHRAKAKMGRLCYYYLRYSKSLGFRRKHRNMILFGQQGTGKGHFAKLVARFIQAAYSGESREREKGKEKEREKESGSVENPVSTPPTPGSIGDLTRASSSDAKSAKSGGVEGEESELTVLRFSKLTAERPELSATKLRRFLEKHKRQVILAKEIEWLEAQPTAVVQAVIRELQSYLDDNPNSGPLLLAARARENLNGILQHYARATPGVIRAHFPFMVDLDKYTAEELRDIFKQQCLREQLRLGNTVTASMLTKTFVLNFSFFDNSNGAGTKHLLTIARMEQARRADRREGMLEAGDIQAAFQRLRQDWYAAHPERTFSTLKEMSQKEFDRRKARSSIANEEDASEDARLALEGGGGLESPGEGEDDASRWSFDIDELKKFHDQEMSRKEEEHKQSLQIYQDECNLFVKEREEALRLTVDRMLSVSTTVAERRYKEINLYQAMEDWKEVLQRSQRLRRLRLKASVISSLNVARGCWVRWVWFIRQRKFVRKQDRRTRRMITCSFLGVVMDVWKELVSSRRTCMRAAIHKMNRLTAVLENGNDVLEEDAMATWWDITFAEVESRRQQLAEVKRASEHEAAINALIRRHQSEVTEWHLSYQEKIRAQKEQRKAAEGSLQPLKQWHHKCNVLAALLVVLYTAPTFPAVAPYFVATLRTFSFGHWYVGLLILASLIGASRRLFSWLHKSVLPNRVKLALNWCSSVGLDAIVVGVGIAWLCWPYVCHGPDAIDSDPASSCMLKPEAIESAELLPCMPEDEPDRSKCDGEEEMGGGERRLGACLPRVEWLFKTVVAVAGWAVTQEGKEIASKIWKEGVGAWLKNTAARIVPSWYYSLSDHNVAEMVDIVQSIATPIGKKTRACMLLADLANQSQEMRNVIMEAGGVKALISILKAAADGELARSAALVLTNLSTTERVAQAVTSAGGAECLIKFWDVKFSIGLVKQSLECCSALVKCGAVSELTNTPKCLPHLKTVLASRHPAVRKHALTLVGDIAAAHSVPPNAALLTPQAGQRLRKDSSMTDDDAYFSRAHNAWRDQLIPLIAPLVSELQNGWWIGLYCSDADCKAAAVRALGFIADGSAEDGDRMVRQGLNQALVRILKIRSTPVQSQESILQLQYEASRTVGVIARGGDLHRGRLQEAGVLNLLDALYQRLMVEPVSESNTKDMALMKQHVLNALQAVKGGGHLLRTPPPSSLSGTSTPNSSSVPSSPRSSPPRGRPKRMGYAYSGSFN